MKFAIAGSNIAVGDANIESLRGIDDGAPIVMGAESLGPALFSVVDANVANLD